MPISFMTISCALFSARSDTALPANTALAGELSLAGELRPVRQMRRRLKAAAALGFSRLLGPAESQGEGGKPLGKAKASDSPEASPWTQVADIQAALKNLFDRKGTASISG